MAQQTAVEWLLQQIENKNGKEFSSYYQEFVKQAKAMEKEQGIDLIKQTAMFMAASTLDSDIGKMSFEDVYNSYYNETYNKYKNGKSNTDI